MIVGRTSRVAYGALPRWWPLVAVIVLVVGFFAVAPAVGAYDGQAIVVHKTETGVLASGGTYDIRITGPDVDRTVSVTAGGSTAIDGLAPGLYELEEIGHPDAVIEPNPVLVPESASYGAEIDVFVTNHVPGARLAIAKVETGTAAPGAAHVFDIAGPVTLTATVTAGTTWTSDWLPLGTYTVTERNAPAGHTITPNPVTLDTDEQTVTVTATNPYPAGRLAIQKVQAGTTGIGPVYMFDVRGPVNFAVEVAAGSTWTSEALPLGTYTITERNAPAGHTILPGSAIITTDGQTVTVVATNPAVLNESAPPAPVRLPATGTSMAAGALAAALIAAGAALLAASHRRQA